MNGQFEIIKLIIAYTLTGAFVFTVVITCASLVNAKLLEKHQQKQLFNLLIGQLVIGCVGFFLNALQFNPDVVQKKVQEPAIKLAKEYKAQRDRLQQYATVQLRTEALSVRTAENIDVKNELMEEREKSKRLDAAMATLLE